ncbi:MAG: radical SAM protein, partial [Myxococcota bacterium]|nr:radical SAM protein [Myxococcota bacterium]
LETLAAHPAFDVAVVGEGEAIADRLVRALAGGGSLGGVPGIAHREGGQPTLTGPAPALEELDELPWPARHLLPNDRYHTVDAWPMTCVIAMRGCPARCTYCNVPALAGRRMRRRSPADVVGEILEAHQRYGVGYVSFLDDTFTTSRRWVVQLCEALCDAGLPGRVAWSCLTRPDLVDPELLATMRAAGLSRVEFGIESGSPRVLERLGKGVELPRIRAAFRAARAAGLVTMGFAMINTPDETPEELAQTEAEVLSIDPDFLQLSFCTPYPGTPLFEYCRDHDLMATTDWNDFRFLRTPVIHNRWLTPEQLRARHGQILRRFYLRPRKAARLARLMLARPGAARSLAATAARGLGHLARGSDG